MDANNDLRNDTDHIVNINDVSATRHEEDINDGPASSTNKKGSHTFARVKSGGLSFSGATKGEYSINPNNLGNLKSDSLMDNRNLGEGHNEEKFPLLEKKYVTEKPKTSCSKKASKPPRPPKGPSLCTSDIVLLRQMSELAMKRRARIEHIKASKRNRALRSSSLSLSSSSSSSSCNTVPALVFTLLILLVLLFQGICSNNSSAKNFEGSPEPAAAAAAAAENEFISVQFYSTLSPSDNSGPSSIPSNLLENGGDSESRYPG